MSPASPSRIFPVPNPYSAAATEIREEAGPSLSDTPALQSAEPRHVALPEELRAHVFGSGSAAKVPPIPQETPGEDDTIFRPITQIQPYYDYSPTGKKPYEYLCPQPSSVPANEQARCPELRRLPGRGTIDRYFSPVNYQWKASDLHHKPLYFEDVPLERYGQKFPAGLQPFVSLGKFGVQLIGLPYQLALDPCWRDQYVLGYYRPGDPAPELAYQIPVNLKAAAAAAGVYTGLIFLFP